MKQWYEAKCSLIEKSLDECMPKREKDDLTFGEVPVLLNNAIRYSLLAGGKRLRPVLLLAAVELCGGDEAAALPLACAVEMIHTYSLIHDDLPAMDDDVLRRGKPTNHVVYGEGQAILAGDGLLTHAFEIMLDMARSHPHPERMIKAMYEMAHGAGIHGMVGGQCQDLQYERSADVRALEYIHASKTAAMIRGAMRAGAYFAGADEEAVEAAGNFGYHWGVAFQIVDDILDVVGDEAQLQKSTGKDAAKGKTTYPSLYGLEDSRRMAAERVQNAIDCITGFGKAAEPLRKMSVDLLSRTR